MFSDCRRVCLDAFFYGFLTLVSASIFIFCGLFPVRCNRTDCNISIVIGNIIFPPVFGSGGGGGSGGSGGSTEVGGGGGDEDRDDVGGRNGGRFERFCGGDIPESGA